jgi:putative DNA primase/helicase
VRLDADELVAVQKTVQVEKKNRADAVEWLQGYLLDGPRRASDVRDDAEQAGISYGTLRRAFAELGGKATALSDSVPRFWMWELPEEGAGG